MRNERKALIDEILDARGPTGNGAGIFGTKTCQACGRPGSFKGWAGAMAAHRGGVFVALGHRHDADTIQRALGPDAPRYCAVCARSTARRTDRDQGREHDPVCERCQSANVNAGRVARFRFLDERCPTVDELKGVRDRIERTLALGGAAPAREIAAAKLTMRRLLRWLKPAKISRALESSSLARRFKIGLFR